MKRSLGLLIAACMLASGLAFAEEATIIDFGTLDADILPDGNGNPTQNSRTVMDFSVNAGSTYTESQKALMKTSLALSQWEVVLNSSSRNVASITNSMVIPAPVKESAEVPFAGSNVMGVRVSFPTWKANANARIVPPYEIPAFDELISYDENGNAADAQTDEEKASGATRFEKAYDSDTAAYGIVKNVGTVKSLAVTTYGMQFPHTLYVLLSDTDGVERRYFMGNLLFDGWKELQWENPSYLSEVRSREFRLYPLYPRGLPYVKFIGFQIVRDASMDGGDFVGYFKDVKIIYDKAVLETDRDIDDEDIWNIVTESEAKKQAWEMSNFGQLQVNRFIEKNKMAEETGFQPTITATEDEEPVTVQ
ncbi:MAG: flagellar protein [Treponema sp. CETP13]|nr:MAG: flagellar protein [Treponema sp. CETP13]